MYVLSKRISFAIIVGAIIVSLSLIFINLSDYGTIGSETDEAALEPEVKIKKADPYYGDLAIEKLYLDDHDTVYSLKNGEVFSDGVKLDSNADSETVNRVLRLALFFLWAKEEPLLFGATLDAEKFAGSVASLKEKETNFLKKYDFRDNIFPTVFLEKFAETSEKYKIFSNEISEKNARSLFQSIESAGEAYRGEIVSLKSIIMALAQDEKWSKTNYAALGGDTYTNTDIILSDLKKMENNASILQKEIEVRGKCLSFSWKDCRRPLEQLEKPELPEKKNIAVPEFLSKEELNLKDDLKYMGPYVINSPCWQDKNEQYLYVSKKCPAFLDYCVQNSVLATNLYFFELVFPHSSFEKSLKEQGVEAIPVNATNYYNCANMEFQSKVATVDYFFTQSSDGVFSRLKQPENFSNYPKELKEIINEGVSAENLFFGAQYPSDESLEYLADFYAYAYSYLVKNDTARNIQAGDKEDLLGRYLLIKEKLKSADSSLYRFTDNFSSFSESFESFSKLESARFYVYSIRSGYSLLFLNHSSSLWKNSAKPRYLKKGGALGRENFYNSGTMDYQTAISKYGRENLMKWVDIFNSE